MVYQLVDSHPQKLGQDPGPPCSQNSLVKLSQVRNLRRCCTTVKKGNPQKSKLLAKYD